MKVVITKLFFVLFVFLFLMSVNFAAANANGSTSWEISANANGTVINYSQIDSTVAEFEVLARVSATQWWAEIWLNSTSIDFGNVLAGADTDAYRQKYKMRARGNVDITVIPTLVDEDDNFFSNLYFSRTYSDWEKIGDYSIIYNLTENVGLWSTLESSGLQNATSSNGLQSIKLDLTNFNEVIPFDEQRGNTVKFVITPVWSSVEPVS